MTARLALVALAACDPAFGLHDTRLVDAHAPPSCRASGPPPFAEQVHQAFFQTCSNVSGSTLTNTAMATCSYPTANENSWGPLDGPLAPITLPAPYFGAAIVLPILAPEGDEAIATVSGTSSNVEAYRLAGDVWIDAGPLDLPVIGLYSAPTLHPNRHVLSQGNDEMVHEFAEDAPGTWHEIMPPYTFTTVAGIEGPPYFSPDGLRMILEGEIVEPSAPKGFVPAVMYSDRPSIDARFGEPAVIPEMPMTFERPYLTPDCARIYFDGLGDVLYIEQP